MSTSRLLLWITFGLEAFLGIPILGGSIIISLLWTPLIIMFVLHLITLNYCIKEGKDRAGSVLGIVASLLGWIPIVGMLLHWVTAVVLFVSALRSEQNAYMPPPPPPQSF